jgi:hypothetical protein
MEAKKSVYVLHSWMSALDYTVEPGVECSDDDPNDVAFVQATATIGGQDAIEEFVASIMFPLASSFSFRDVTAGTTPVLKVQTLLLLFPIELVYVGDADRVLAEVETEAERFLGSFKPREHDALKMAKLPNGGCLNHVLEQMGVAYAPHPLPGSNVSQVARDKRKAEVTKKQATKMVKTGTSRATPSKTVTPLPKTAPPLPKMGHQN